ncbi:MAG: hypothetical protein HN816_13655, partial [Gammaproteobacteria bacterium]|nr:hypothetical protein [Gammaproteobacteria bacterium]
MRNRLAIPATVLLIFIVIISALPLCIQYVATSQVRELGMGELTIENVDFNPFTLELVIDQYNLTHENQQYLLGNRLAVDLAWSELVTGRIGIEKIALTQAEFWARETPEGEWLLVPPMKTSTTEDSAATSPLEYVLNSLSITETSVHIEGQQISGDFELPNLDLNDLANFESEVSDTTTQVSANWGDATITIDTHKELMADEPPFEVKLQITSLSLTDFQKLAGLPELDGRVNATIDLHGKLNRSPLIDSDDPLGLSITADISVTVTDLSAQDPAGVIQLGVHETSWQGSLEATVSEAGTQYSMMGDLSVSSAAARQGETTVIGWNKATITGLSLDSAQNIGFSELGFRGLKLFGKESPALETTLTITDLSLVPGQTVNLNKV